MTLPSLIRSAAALFLVVLPLFPLYGAGNTPEGKTLETTAPAVELAKDGKALVPIVISPDRSPELQGTAAELAAYLKQITGAEFTVKESREPEGITLGTLEQFPRDDLKEPLAIKEGYDGIEAYAIQSGDGKVLLLANTDLGASYAAYRFLELLGCRWFFPGPTWEIVPSVKDLSFNLNEIPRPDIWSRDIWFGRTKQKCEEGDPDGTAVFNAWKRRNRLGESLKVKANHRWQAIPNQYKEEFAGHPEYYALVDGKRTPPQFCVTNEGLQKVILRYVNEYFQKNPEADMVSLDPADQAGWCTCEKCKKLGHHSNQAFYLSNIAAKELQKTHPGKYVGLLAYSWHSEAPPFALEPNVYVQLTSGMNASKFTFDQLFDQWTDKRGHLGIYEYYSYWQMDRAMFPGRGPSNRLDDIDERIKRFRDNNVNSISAQATNSWGVNGLGYYQASKLMWNADADVRTLRKDFYEKAFGSAASAMERYYERLNLSNDPLPGVALLRLSLDDIEEAISLAANRPDVMARLNALRGNLVYNYLGQKVDTAEDGVERKQRILEWFKWAYRTRNNYMNDWITFRSTVGRPAAEEMNEPTWFWRNTRENPWRVDEPVTPKELTQKFQEIKEDVGEVPSVTRKEISNDYVLVNTDRSAKATRKLLISGTATFLVASPDGEPLKLHLVKRDTGTWDTPDTRYWLSTLDGKEVTSGQVDVGGHDLVLSVPESGIYRFSAKSGGVGWEMDFPDELSHALLVERGVKGITGMFPGYFYVPKGTTEIALYTAPRLKTTLEGPDGQMVKEIPGEGRYTVIPVEPGQAGKVWSIAGRIRDLHFFNLPTVLSASPDRVFVPREVAKSDGLEIVAPR